MAGGGPSRKVASLLALSLPSDAVSLGSLPPPDRSVIGRLSAARLGEVAEHFHGLWRDLTLGVWKPNGAEAAALVDEDDPDKAFWAVLQVVGAYYGYSLFRFAAKGGAESARAFLRRAETAVPVPDHTSKAAVADWVRRWQAAILLNVCNDCASNLVLAASIDEQGFQPGDLARTNDADLIALETLEQLQGAVTEFDEELAALAGELLCYALEYRRVTVHERSERRRKALQDPGALVSIPELVLLSSRDEYMVEKYGAKEIEATFERQIRRIFETLGFVVIPARPGEAAADLLCVSVEPEGRRFSFLVDAKTSARHYALPKDDQRAIADYVADLPPGTPVIPKLAFVLLVGPKLGKAAPRKMAALEARTGVKIRYVETYLLATLQQSLAGPVLPRPFREAVVAAPYLLGTELINRMQDVKERLFSAHASPYRDLRDIF
jgi:hypothetical protein